MSKDKSSQPIKRLKTGSLARGISLAMTGMKAGARLGSYSLSSLFVSGDQKQEHRSQMLTDQARLLAEELGKLKGSVMKVGQLLGLYGEHFFLPPEVVEALRTLQDDSPPLHWKALRKALERELGAARLTQLEIDPQPLAAASMGQVHRAWRLRDNRELCLKIQYPGVAESIDSDLNTLGRLLLFSRVLPKGFDLGDMLAEVRSMLHQEVDYQMELETVQTFRQLLAADARFRVPEVFPEYSTRRVLALSYETGLAVDGPEARQLPQIQRNRLGKAALELFLREFFDWNLVQTDPNFGNYRIRINPDTGQEQLVLLDFGAVRQFPDAFRLAYYEMVRGAFWKDKERLWKAATELFLPVDTPRSTLERFADMCFLIVEPFQGKEAGEAGARFTNDRGEYCWGASDLPQRVTLAASKASLTFSFRIPPKEFVFLHRKLAGVFVFLAELDTELDARPLLLPYMGEPAA